MGWKRKGQVAPMVVVRVGVRERGRKGQMDYLLGFPKVHSGLP